MVDLHIPSPWVLEKKCQAIINFIMPGKQDIGRDFMSLIKNKIKLVLLHFITPFHIVLFHNYFIF